MLVVEDTPEHIERARALQGDYNITVVGTYKGAVKAIARGEYDVILTDLFIPWHTEAVDPLNPNNPEMRLEAVTPRALGYPLAMVALAAGVHYVGIVTDANHHTGVMAASIGDDVLHYGNLIPQEVLGNEKSAQLRVFYDERKNWGYAIKVLLGNGTSGLEDYKLKEAELEKNADTKAYKGRLLNRFKSFN